MLPNPDINDTLQDDFVEVVEPSLNYRLQYEQNHIAGYVDELEAMRQTIFMLLSVERYDHIIYSLNAGVEFRDLFGKPTSYVASEVKRRIEECLLQDNRITRVYNFVVTARRSVVTCSYTAETIFGEIQDTREVRF